MSEQSPIGWGAPPAPCALVRFDDAGHLSSVNAYLRRVLGLAIDAPLPPRFSDLLSPPSRILFQSSVLPGLRLRGEVSESFLSLRCSDGTDLPMLANFVRDTGADGPQVHAALMPMRDRKRLEDELLGARASAEQVPGVLFQLLRAGDGRLSFPFASRGIQSIFGVTPARARESADPVLARVHPEDRRRLLDSLSQSGERLQPWVMELRVLPDTLADAGHEADRDGAAAEPRWVEAQGSAEGRPDGAVLWHGYLHDVSERRALQRSLHERELAVRANQSKSAFLARVSHEMRTPLNAVLGFAQLLSSDSQLQVNEQQRSHVSHIESAARSLLLLIDEVLDIERVEAGSVTLNLAPVALESVMGECAAMLALMAQVRAVSITIELPDGLWVMADRAKLAQCLNNLVSNAIKYNRSGGQITLAAARVGDRVRLLVRDTGPGMNADQLTHLFEPFNRLGAERTRTQGSGLGLVITRALVALLGGELEVSSQLGEGTCFAFELPLAAAPAAPADPASVAAPAVMTDPLPGARDTAGRARHLIYIEDDPVNQLLMVALVERLPHLRLSLAESGAVGLALALSDPPDLLLLDMHLPDTDGIELLPQLRSHAVLHDVPAVMVSANALTSHIDDAAAAGFEQYWVKPLELEKTLALLSERFPPPARSLG